VDRFFVNFAAVGTHARRLEGSENQENGVVPVTAFRASSYRCRLGFVLSPSVPGT
jgi:hypothetical protein